MAKFKFGDLVQKGLDAPEEGERWDPPAGWSGRVKVKKVFVTYNNDELPQFGVMVEVQATGEHKGKTFFINAGFSAAYDFMNRRAVDVLTGFGISAAQLKKMDEDAVASALEGMEGIVTASYSKKKKQDGSFWSNHGVSPIKKTAPVTGRPPVDDDEDDEDYDDEPEDEELPEEDEEDEEEPPPPPAKKTRAKPAAKGKAKAKPEPEPEDDEDIDGDYGDWDADD